MDSVTSQVNTRGIINETPFILPFCSFKKLIVTKCHSFVRQSVFDRKVLLL